MRSLPGPLHIALALLALALPASAATITVDQSKGQTIQGAIDVAVDGDTVLVGPGTYFEHIDFKGEAITVTSTLAADPAAIIVATNTTIIDGSSTGPAVTSSADYHNMDFAPVLQYFTIQNGGSPAPGGDPAGYGGVYVSHFGLDLTSNMIKNNNFGGIVLAANGFAILRSNTITHNTCWGIEINGGSAIAILNEVSKTQTPATGCTVTDFSSTFSTNSSGILIDENIGTQFSPSSLIYENTIESNVQAASPGAPIEGGAAIALYYGKAEIDSNTIRYNSAPFARGGAIDIVHGESVNLVENLIYKNRSGCGGGAVAFDFAGLQGSLIDAAASGGAYSLLIANNTIADNTVTPSSATGCSDASQIDAAPDGLSSPAILLLNNVISSSTPAIGTDCHQQATPSLYDQSVFDHNLIYNAGDAFFGGVCVDESANPLFGNLVANPQFVNPIAGDYSLQSISPGIDAGSNTVFWVLYSNGEFINPFDPYSYIDNPKPVSDNPRDIALKPRLRNATAKLDGAHNLQDVIDIGAYEFSGSTSPSTAVTLAMPPIGYPTVVGPGTLLAHVTGFETSIGTQNTPSGTVTFFVDGTKIGDPAPIGSVTNPFNSFETVGLASVPVNFSPGVHILTATYQPVPMVDSAESAAVVIDIARAPTGPLALLAAPNSVDVGNPVTFTVTAPPAYNAYIPTPISLSDVNTNTVIGTVTPDMTTGVGTFTTTTLAPGFTVVQASFAGSGVYLPSISNQVTVQVRYPTALILKSSQNPAVALTPFNLTATLSDTDTTPATGFVTFYAIRTQPGSFPQAIGRTNIAADSATRAVSLAAGTYNLTAFYAGDALHSASTSIPIPETVVGLTTTTTLTSALNPASAFQSVPLTAHVAGPATATAGTITGTVTFLSNGKSIGTSKVGTDGSATLNPGFSPGTYALTASYAGDDSFAASTSAAITEVVGRGNTATSLSATPNPGYTPGSEAIQSLVSPNALTSGSMPLPTGTVAFFDGGNLIANSPFDATLSNGAQADLSVSNLTVGIHILTAVYSGDSNYLPSTSAALTLNVVLSDFTLATEPTLIIQTEHHKTTILTLASLGNFAETVAITCGNLPAFASCNFPQGGLQGSATLTAGNTQTVAININTDVAFNFKSDLQHPVVRPDSTPGNGSSSTDLRGAIAFTLLLPFGLLATRRRSRLFLAAIALLVLSAAAALTGCSGHYPDHTPPGTYTITISGTGATTHLTHTTTMTLIVTP